MFLSSKSLLYVRLPFFIPSCLFIYLLLYVGCSPDRVTVTFSTMDHDDRAYQYVRFRVVPSIPSPDALWIRKLIQDALQESFGNTSANIYMDILWNKEQEVIVRLDSGLKLILFVRRTDADAQLFSDVTNLLAAVAMDGRMSLLKQSSFLPALSNVALDSSASGDRVLWGAGH